jgi:hypothetical protein
LTAVNGVNLRDPGQAGLLVLGAVLLVVTPLCVAMAALHAGLTAAAVAILLAVPAAAAVVARVARGASPARDAGKPEAGDER